MINKIIRTCQLCGISANSRLITSGKVGEASYYEPLMGWTFTLVGKWRCSRCQLTQKENQEEDKFRVL